MWYFRPLIYLFEIIQTENIGDGKGEVGKQHLQKGITFINTSETYKLKTHSLHSYQFD